MNYSKKTAGKTAKGKKMANKRFLWGMLAIVLVLVFGMTVVGCGDGSSSNDNDGSLDGTWNMNSYSITISGNTCHLHDGLDVYKGTVSYDGSSFTYNVTHYWDDAWIPYSYSLHGNYTLSGTSLTFSISGDYDFLSGVWTKQ
jgi:hypothetical protein